MSKWKEGLRFISGTIEARVPTKKKGTYKYETFNVSKCGGILEASNKAKKWQEIQSRKIWGSEWKVAVLQGSHKCKQTHRKKTGLPQGVRHVPDDLDGKYLVKYSTIPEQHLLSTCSLKRLKDVVKLKQKTFQYTGSNRQEVYEEVVRFAKKQERRYIKTKTKFLDK